MVSFSLSIIALATIGAYAKPTARAVGGLEVSLSSPVDKVASVSELRIITTVKNVGDKDLKILKPGSVLDNQRPTRSFVVRKDGKVVDFTGIKISLSMAHLSEDDWAVIPAGKTVTAEHNVSALYDFSATGPGTFTFDPVSGFQVIDDTVGATFNTVRSDIVNARSVAVTVTFTDDVSKRPLHLDKRAVAVCGDDPDRTAYLLTAQIESKILSFTAKSYIEEHGGLNNSVYNAYFGSNPLVIITSNFSAIGNEADSSRLLSCEDPWGQCGGIIPAYTDMLTRNMYFCPIFFKQVDASTLCNGNTVDNHNIRGSTVIHQMFHSLVGETEDYARFGCYQDQRLSDDENMKNADSYGCFAAEAWFQTKCCVGDKKLEGCTHE